MITKKENNSIEQAAKICLVNLKECMARPDYLGKTEKEPLPNSHKYFKIIIIKTKGFTYEFKLNKKEYDDYKRLEREFWGAA